MYNDIEICTRLGDIMNSDARKRLILLLTDELPVLRAKIGISQDEIAKRIGISRQTYSLIETKKQAMTWLTFMGLLAFFENNERSLSQLSAIGFFNEQDFLECIQYLK